MHSDDDELDHLAKFIDPTNITQGSSNATSKTAAELVHNQKNKKPRISELDKFKRRLIRAVARLLLEDKKPEEEVWKELKNETNCDCKLLWTRMSALTIKKLKRLFIANDEIAKVTKIAQLTVTDWLLFDLVLVHEDVDVIGEEINPECKTDLKILEDLFELVLKYRIEYNSGDILTIAWYELTAEYNRRGRKCSPMLLQRRWYQMKEQVRNNFYNFWYAYRGLQSRLDEADKHKPTELQIQIVNHFLAIVTEPFKTWEELINQKRVSLFNDFERLKLSKNKSAQSENGPDVEVIEQLVETIDIDSDNDVDPNEDLQDSDKTVNDTDNTSSNVVETETTESKICNSEILNIKAESYLCDEDDVRALESMHIPLANNEIKETYENIKGLKQKKKPNEIVKKSAKTDCTTQAEKSNGLDNADIVSSSVVESINPEDEDDDIIVIDDQKVVESKVLSKIDNVVIPILTNLTSTTKIPEISIDDDDDLPQEINNVLKKVADDMGKNKRNISAENKLGILTTDVIKVEDRNIYSDIHLNDLQLTEGIELVDDGIEFVDEDISDIEDSCTMYNEDGKLDEEVTPKIDLKLLLNPVVYTKRLDDMDVFRFLDYIAVKDPRVIEFSAMESKPYDKKSINMEDIAEEHRKSKDNNSERESEFEDSDSDEEEKVDSRSWLFYKLKEPTFNPIQLCKNPDFNTRLKRLTAGFLSSQRNRLLLKECKPLTIDLHKAFESKLVDNTLYLKTSHISTTLSSETINSVVKTVSPCNLPGQNLTSVKTFEETKSGPTIPKIVPLCNEDIVPEVHEVERNKIINLPDIEQIRRTNEKLLTAEVTPIQVSNISHKHIKTLVDINDKNMGSFQIKDATDKQGIIPINQSLITTTEGINDVTSIQEKATDVNSFDSSKLSRYMRKKLEKGNVKPTYKKAPENITWVARKLPKMSDIPTDRFLALDTVKRIISVCKGIIPVQKKKKKRRPYVSKKNNITNVTQSIDKSIDNEKAITDKEVTLKQSHSVIDKNSAPNNNKKKVSYKEFCCWAQQKLLFLEKKIKTVTLSHNCPQKKCVCCCSMEYCKKLVEINRDMPTGSVSLNSENESKQNSESKRLHFKNKTNKVSIGINTDFDKDFEESYAANLTLYNSNVNLCSTDNRSVICKTNFIEKDFNCATQTVHCNITTPIAKAIPQINVTFDSGPIISDVRSVPLLKTNPKVTMKGSKCKIVVRSAPSAKNFTEKNELPDVNTNIEITKEKCNNSNATLINDNLKSNLTKTPICLGKDKILLYSLKPISKESLVDVNEFFSKQQSFLPFTLPNGINLALLPNQQLVVSIDPGVELDSNQIASLPSIVAAVQQQLVSVGVISKESVKKLQTDEVIQLSDDDNSTETVKTNRSQGNSIEKKHLDTSVKIFDNTLSEISGSDASYIVENCPSDIQQEIVSPSMAVDNDEKNTRITKTQENKAPCAIITENEVAGLEIDTNNFTNTQKELEPVNYPKDDPKNNDIVGLNVEIDNADSSTTDQKVLEPVNYPKDDPTNNDIVGLNVEVDYTNSSITDQTDASKKTILSDLMEMSGISLDDTNTQNIETPIITETRSEVPNVNNITPTSQNLSISNPLLNNLFIQHVLLKFPDLSVLSTFDELKFAHKNGGQFYKMCLKTGIIAPINVCIKKLTENMCKKLIPKTKAIIDLTEDEQVMTVSRSDIEVNKTKRILPKPAQPIKLFKALHPSLLKRPRILKRLYPFKRFNNETNTKVKITSLVNSDSDDDEPLALKVKRKRDVANTNQAMVSKENSLDEKTINLDDPLLEAATHTETMLTDNQEFDENVSVEPVFWNNDDSMEEDCILGV